MSVTICNSPRGAAHGVSLRARLGFTMPDLLVSIAVVAVLIAILAPSLIKSYEMARRVVCMSNVRQIGYAVAMYADDNEEELPGSIFLPDDSRSASGTHNSIFLHVDARDERASELGLDFMDEKYKSWDGIGYLFGEGYLSHPNVFYCPSHHGEHRFEDYQESWARRTGIIAGNYQFRIDPEYRFRDEIPSTVTLLADSMRTQEDYNHVEGNNLLRADMSVEWFQDVGDQIYNSLAAPGVAASTMQNNVDDAWKYLDDGGDNGPTMLPDVPLTAGSGN